FTTCDLMTFDPKRYFRELAQAVAQSRHAFAHFFACSPGAFSHWAAQSLHTFSHSSQIAQARGVMFPTAWWHARHMRWPIAHSFASASSLASRACFRHAAHSTAHS